MILGKEQWLRICCRLQQWRPIELIKKKIDWVSLGQARGVFLTWDKRMVSKEEESLVLLPKLLLFFDR